MNATTNAKHPEEEPWVQIVHQQVGSLRFGVAQIVVHDGGVVQIERTEKGRLDFASGVSSSTFNSGNLLDAYINYRIMPEF